MSGALPERSAGTLALIAANPAAIAAQMATLFAGLDALADAYMHAAPEGLTDRQRAMRKPAAVWAAMQSHCQNRITSMRARAGA